MKKDYSIFLISHQPHRYTKIQESLLPETLYYYDGTGAPSFSKIVNSVAEYSRTENVIIVGHKSFPKSNDIKKMVDLLNSGYGLVGLRKFAFFGFKKQLLRQIGMFDERFAGGGWEDNDIIMRMIMANIAYYMTEEIEYHPEPTTWDYGVTLEHFTKKWHHDWENNINGVPIFTKMLDEESYNYNLGPYIKTNFLTCKGNTFDTTVLSAFMHTKIRDKKELS